jgi:hypothetical protein
MAEIVLQSIGDLSSRIVPPILAAVIGYEYRKRRQEHEQKKEETDEWYESAQRIFADGRYTAERRGIRSDIDAEAVSEHFEELSKRLEMKIESAPDTVPDEALGVLRTVIPLYAKGSVVAEVSNEKNAVEATAELFEIAQREFSAEADLDTAMEEAREASGIYEIFLEEMESSGVEKEEFIESMEQLLLESSKEDFMYLLSMWGAGVELEDTLQLVNRLFLQLSHSYSTRGYELLEMYQNGTLPE